MGNTQDVNLSPKRQMLHAFQMIFLSPTRTGKAPAVGFQAGRQTDNTVGSGKYF